MAENENKPEVEEVKAEAETESKKDVVEQRIRKQIEKKQEKDSHMGISRIGEYLKEEHQWENYLFLAVAIITLVLGCLILEGSLEVKESFPVIGSHPTAFAWVLIGISLAGLLYALWPFFKPALPEFKKVTWLTGMKFLGNIARTFIFMLVLIGLLYMYDALMSEIFVLIFN